MNQDLWASRRKPRQGDLKSRMIVAVLMATLVTGGALVGVGCERQGPAERAGQGIDRMVEDVKDKLDPPGPVEKAGKTVDRAVEDLTK